MRTTELTVAITAGSLAGLSVLAGLSATVREKVAARCVGRMYGPHEVITTPTDRSRDVYFIVSGRVKVALFSRSGREVVFRTMDAGAMFGELAAVDGEHRSAVIQALQEVHAAVLSQSQFLRLLRDDPDFSLSVLRHVTGLVRSLSQRVFEHDALKVGGRLHAELMRLARSHGVTDNKARIDPAPTDEAFARIIGTNRTGVSREFAKLREYGIVARRGSALVIADVDLLETLASEYDDKYTLKPSISPETNC